MKKARTPRPASLSAISISTSPAHSCMRLLRALLSADSVFCVSALSLSLFLAAKLISANDRRQTLPHQTPVPHSGSSGRRTLIMGSERDAGQFFDGSKFYNEEKAIEHALQMEQRALTCSTSARNLQRPGSEGIPRRKNGEGSSPCSAACADF